MKAIVIESPGQVRLAEVALPTHGPGEVLIRSRAVGICGSDVELYQGTRPEGFYRYPLVPGHEWSGEVAAIGERVHGLSVGDGVVAEGFLACGACRNCRTGLTNLCEAGYDEIGFTRPGGLAEYVVAPARQVHALPAGASFQEAALLEPAAVVAQAFLRAPPQAAGTVVVIGDGTIGLLAVQIARLFSPAALTLVGSHDERLGMMTVRGNFLEITATGYIDPGHPEASSVDITIQAASIRTHNPQRDNDLRSSNLLDADKYPTITFKSTRIEQTGQDRYTLTGDLTIKGTTRPVTLAVVKYGEFNDPMMGHRIGYSAQGKINRKDFGMTFNMMLDGRLIVSEEVQIFIEGEFIEQKQEQSAEATNACKSFCFVGENWIIQRVSA